MSEGTDETLPKEIILSKKGKLPAVKLVSFPWDVEELLKVTQEENRRLKTLVQTLKKNLVELHTIFQNLDRIINIEDPDPEEVREYLRIHVDQGYNFESTVTDLINFLTTFLSVGEENIEHIVLEAVRELDFPIIKKTGSKEPFSVFVDRKWFKFALKSALNYLIENFEIPSPGFEISLNEFEDFLLLSISQQEIIHTSYFPEETFSSLQIQFIETIMSSFGGKFWFQLDRKTKNRFFRSSITGTIERQHFSKILLFFTLPLAESVLK